MNKEELIEKLEFNFGCGFDIPLNEDEVDMCIEALEKQIAKKPLVKWNLYKCCTCNGVVYEQEYNYKYSYCSNCGQKQDWSVFDE